MTDPHTIELQLDDERVPLHVQRTATSRSRHTGKPLTEVHAVASTSDPAVHERWTRAFRDLGGRMVRTGGRTPGGVTRWCVSWNSYTPLGAEHAHTLLLREVEDLSLEALVVDAVELHPYEYREEFTGDELTISAKLVGSKAAVLRLRALLKTRETFPVVRRGISDEPREMRFGVAEWSEHEGQIRVRMVLVDADADLAEHPEVVRIEEANTRAALAFYMSFVDRLAELVQRKGIATAEEVEAAREAARNEPWPQRREFWRVRDVDLL